MLPVLLALIISGKNCLRNAWTENRNKRNHCGKGRPTTLKTRIVAHGQQMVRFDKENREPIPQTSTNKILEYIKSLRKKIGAIVISDYNKGVISKELIEGIKKIAEDSKIFICLDPKQNNYSIYKGVHVITPNHHEAQHAAGMEITNADDIQRLSESLLKKYAFQAMLITRGEEGMSLFENGRKLFILIFRSGQRSL